MARIGTANTGSLTCYCGVTGASNGTTLTMHVYGGKTVINERTVGNAAVSWNGSLIQNYGGTLTVDPSNQFQTGNAVTITNGTAYLESKASWNVTGDVLVDTNGLLEVCSSNTETMTIAPNSQLEIRGTLTLGDTSGDYPIFNVSGNVTLDTGGVMNTQCDMTSMDCGELDVTGTASLGNGTLNATGNGTPGTIGIHTYNVVSASNPRPPSWAPSISWDRGRRARSTS